jgi:predicted lysophospholipase L1 biosynthesis ABC-type transport system permease subunit
MYLLLAVGLALIFVSSFFPSIAAILTDSVSAIAVQVCYYYGLAGLVCAVAYRDSYRESVWAWLFYAVYPFLSAISLFVLGIYAISGYNLVTKIVGIGGLAIGILFFRPSGYGFRLGQVLAR